MGNCAVKARARSSPPATSAPPPPPRTVRIYASDTCPVALRLHVALLYKPGVSVKLVPSDNGVIIGGPMIRCGTDTVSGPVETLLRYLDARFGGPTSAVEASGVEAATALQHRSMDRHAERMAGWAGELVAAGGGAAGDAKRMGRRYGQLVEVMLGHARMEERVLFPELELAADDQDICRMANEEHGRDLPIMNGIKEDIKSLIAMEPGTPLYQEALHSLSIRFSTLQRHCKEHFEAEEKQLLPLLEAAERIGREEPEAPVPSASVWLAEQAMEAMEGTHSHLFLFFMAGLLPEEAMKYVDIVCRYTRRPQPAEGGRDAQFTYCCGETAYVWDPSRPPQVLVLVKSCGKCTPMKPKILTLTTYINILQLAEWKLCFFIVQFSMREDLQFLH